MKSISYLRKYDIKPSMQRLAIMDYLLDHCCTHPSVVQIYDALSPMMPKLTKATVYQSLRLFVEHRAILMITINEHNVHFDADISPHAHFLCKRCSRIYDLPVPPGIKYVEPQLLGDHVVSEMYFYYKGTCLECLAKERVFIV